MADDRLAQNFIVSVGYKILDAFLRLVPSQLVYFTFLTGGGLDRLG